MGLTTKNTANYAALSEVENGELAPQSFIRGDGEDSAFHRSETTLTASTEQMDDPKVLRGVTKVESFFSDRAAHKIVGFFRNDLKAAGAISDF
jgi:hypothetical protein